MGREYFDVTFDLGPLFQGQVRVTDPKSDYSSLINLLLTLEVWNVKPTCEKIGFF